MLTFLLPLRIFGLKGFGEDLTNQNVADYFLNDGLSSDSFVHPDHPTLCSKKLAHTDKTKGTHHNRRVLGGISTSFDVDEPGFLETPTGCVTLAVSEMDCEKFIRLY